MIAIRITNSVCILIPYLNLRRTSDTDSLNPWSSIERSLRTTVLQYKLQKIFENYLKTKEQADYTAYISPVHQN